MPQTQSSEVLKRRKKHQLGDFDKSQTIQSECDKCNINNIVAQYRETGLVDHIRENQGNYGDFSSAEDFQSSMNKVVKAQQSFDQLPSEIRTRFQNDPAEFLKFVLDEKNHPEMEKMGLIPTQEPSQTTHDKPSTSSSESSEEKTPKTESSGDSQEATPS